MMHDVRGSISGLRIARKKQAYCMLTAKTAATEHVRLWEVLIKNKELSLSTSVVALVDVTYY